MVAREVTGPQKKKLAAKRKKENAQAEDKPAQGRGAYSYEGHGDVMRAAAGSTATRCVQPRRAWRRAWRRGARSRERQGDAAYAVTKVQRHGSCSGRGTRRAGAGTRGGATSPCVGVCQRRHVLSSPRVIAVIAVGGGPWWVLEGEGGRVRQQGG